MDSITDRTRKTIAPQESSIRGSLINIVIIAASAGVLVGYFFVTGKTDLLLTSLGTLDMGWFLGAIVCMIAYWLFETLTLQITGAGMGCHLTFSKSLHTSMIGQLFNNITPFSTGGQPAQAYCMLRNGIPIGNASSILLAKFIIYQSVLTVFSALALLLRINFFTLSFSELSYLAVTGFLVHLAVIAALVSVACFPRFAVRLVNGGVRFLSKIKVLKNPDPIQASIQCEMSDFFLGLEILKNDAGVVFKTAVLTTLQLTVFFAIPYFVCRSLGLVDIDPLTMICAASFVLMVTSFFPLPGASGGAEGSFYLFFAMFFTQTGTIAVAILLWRALTFYLPIIIGLLFCNQRFFSSPPKNATVPTI